LRVAVATAVRAPPMMPASPTAPPRSAMTSMSSLRLTVRASRSCKPFCRARAAHADFALQSGQIVGMHRLPELKQHVVRDIDDRADAAHIRALQSRGEPGGSERLIVDAANYSAAESRTGFGSSTCTGKVSGNSVPTG